MAYELDLLVERNLGQWLKRTERAEGAKGIGPIVVDSSDRNRNNPTLSELGISKDESSDAQALASMPKEQIERIKEYDARWSVIEGYHQIGKRILKENDSFARENVYAKKISQCIAKSLGRSTRTVDYAVQFAKKYPTLEKLREEKRQALLTQLLQRVVSRWSWEALGPSSRDSCETLLRLPPIDLAKYAFLSRVRL